MKDFLNYKAKVCVVTGSASGIGAELVKLLKQASAYVIALDYRVTLEADKFYNVNLSKKEEIDRVLETLPKVDCLFSNAGLPGIFYGDDRFAMEEVFAVNYCAARYITEDVASKMTTGGRIAITSSCVGNRFMERADIYEELIHQYSTYEGGKIWCKKYMQKNREQEQLFLQHYVYGVSKEALSYYIRSQMVSFQKRGIRLNGIAPGAVDTLMTSDFPIIAEYFGQTDFDDSKAAINPFVGRASSAYEQALALLFLNSDLAVSLSGEIMETDFGFDNAVSFGKCDENGNFTD